MINDIVMKTVKTFALVILAAFSLAAFSGCKEKTMTNVQYVLRNNSSHMLEIIHPKIGDNTLMPGENFQFSFTYKESDWEKAVKKDGILGGSSTVVVDGKTKYTVKNNEGFCKLDNYGLTKKGSTSCIANYSFTDAVIASLTK